MHSRHGELTVQIPGESAYAAVRDEEGVAYHSLGSWDRLFVAFAAANVPSLRDFAVLSRLIRRQT